MSSKGRTELIIGVSEAKYCKELDVDVQKCPAPQKLIKNVEKLNFRVGKIRKLVFRVGKSNVGNRLKRIMAKFEADRS